MLIHFVYRTMPLKPTSKKPASAPVAQGQLAVVLSNAIHNISFLLLDQASNKQHEEVNRAFTPTAPITPEDPEEVAARQDGNGQTLLVTVEAAPVPSPRKGYIT